MAWEDRDAFRRMIARVFPNEGAAMRVLRPLGFPESDLPAWIAGMNSEDWWSLIFREFDNGIIPEPFRRLLRSALDRYGSNPGFLELSDRYLVPAQAGPEPAPDGRPATCHVIVRASDENERESATAALADLGLDPREIWSTEHAVSYAVNSTDVELVRRALGRTRLGWTLVPPGQPDYLLRELFVQGPDGSRFRFTDAPAAQTVRNITTEVIGQYPDSAGETVPAVADQVLASGERRRLDMDDTLHDAGIRDGDSLRVGVEGRAGAVNPLDQQDALDRVFHQVVGYAKAHPGVSVRANRTERPSEYEIDFVQDSLGPPDVEGGEPRLIREHTLLLQFGEEFPVTPPDVFWLTPIFHPNVFPNYDCEQSRRQPNLQGWVCLGMLNQSWSPATDFGEVLQMLVAIAGYRNYELFGPNGEPNNFVDRAAAAWVLGHQAEIVDKIGGNPIAPRPQREPGYPNVIARLGHHVDTRLG